MNENNKKRHIVNFIMAITLTLGVIITIVSPINVSANSTNVLDRILYVEDGYTNDANLPAASYLMINEDDVEFTTGDTFRLSLPSGVEWITSKYAGQQIPGTNNASFTVIHVNNQDLELTISGTWSSGKESVKIPLYFKVDGGEGELKVTVKSRGSTISSGQYTFAVVSDKKTKVTVLTDRKSSGYNNVSLNPIRIDELAVGAMEAGKKIVFTLPSKYRWGSNAIVLYEGAYSGSPDAIVIPEGNKLIIDVPTPAPNKLGTIYVEGLSIEIDKDAPFGDIELDISGEATNETIIIASRSDYTTRLTAEDPKTLIAGRDNTDLDDLETAEIKLFETVEKTWADNRKFKIELPEWTKIVGYEITTAVGLRKNDMVKVFNAEIKGDHNEVEVIMPSSRIKRRLYMKFYVSTKADAQGDVTATISGAGIDVKPVVIAKVIPPVTTEVIKANVQAGVKNQPLKDIIISETTKGTLTEGNTVELKLSDNVKYSNKPIVEVIEGDLEIDESSIDVENGILTFDIDYESRKASKIKISNLKIDLDRTVPQGDIDVKIGGSALVKNQDFSTDIAFKGNYVIGDKSYDTFDISSSSIDVGEFARTYVVKQAVATVETPAEGRLTAHDITFKIDSPIYMKGNIENIMDVSPFIEANRTYLPIRYVAEAIGVDESNIFWNDAIQQVTIIKGDRIVQLTVDSNVLIINGIDTPIDVEVKNVNGRTVLPLRSVTQALGAQVVWNEEEQTITIK